MCALTPIIELESLKFDIMSLAELSEKGSYEQSQARNAARGICDRIDWTIATLKAGNEGGKNFGLKRGYDARR